MNGDIQVFDTDGNQVNIGGYSEEQLRQIERERDVYCVLEAVAPREGIPQIPEEYKEKLEDAYYRYEHFIGICSGGFEKAEIEEDRQKYKHLLIPDHNGMIVFSLEECMDYMNLTSGVPKVYCAVFEYEKTINLIASGVIPGSPLENMKEEHSITRQIIEEIEKEEKSSISVDRKQIEK